MGVDYTVWIIPHQRTFRPNAEQFSNLANALSNSRWVPKPEAMGQGSEICELLPCNDAFRRMPERTKKFDPEPFTPGWVEFHSEHELVLRWWSAIKSKLTFNIPSSLVQERARSRHISSSI